MPKRSKAANNNGEEGSIEVEKVPVKKAAMEGKGKKGKKTRCVAGFLISVLANL